MNRGVLKRHQEHADYREILPDFDEAINLNRHNWVAYYDRIAARYAVGNYKGAQNDCRRFLGLEPPRVDHFIDELSRYPNLRRVLGDYLTKRGRRKFASGDTKGAQEDFEKLVILYPIDR